MRRIYCLLCSVCLHHIFATLSHKRQDFRKKRLFIIKSVFSYSVQTFCDKFVTLRIIQQDIIINVLRTSCKLPVILVAF